jgi:hypothetical protein
MKITKKEIEGLRTHQCDVQRIGSSDPNDPVTQVEMRAFVLSNGSCHICCDNCGEVLLDTDEILGWSAVSKTDLKKRTR